MKYSDWPECLPRYRWCVEEAVRFDDPERMLSVNRSTLNQKWDAICKVCGAGLMRRGYRDHLAEHVADLKLSPDELASRYPKGAKLEPGALAVEPLIDHALLGEVEEIVLDVLAGFDEDGGPAFGKKLSKELASAIVGFVEAHEGTEPPLCADCQLS